MFYVPSVGMLSRNFNKGKKEERGKSWGLSTIHFNSIGLKWRLGIFFFFFLITPGNADVGDLQNSLCETNQKVNQHK